MMEYAHQPAQNLMIMTAAGKKNVMVGFQIKDAWKSAQQPLHHLLHQPQQHQQHWISLKQQLPQLPHPQPQQPPQPCNKKTAHQPRTMFAH